ncbi:MAG: gliding motility-associated C-terminal domain-containing protein [Aureispira sp.]
MKNNRSFWGAGIRIVGYLCLFLWSQQSWATHIVGGDMTYRCLGNDQYEVSINIFRDCDTGVPWFGDSILIERTFGLGGTVVDRFTMYLRQKNDTLPITSPDSCLIINTTACIHTTTYIDTIELPFNATGYTLAYRVCCRNRDIVNIEDPLWTRATYWTYLPPEALQACNSSPVFNETPPVYICVDKPLNINYSAVDPDGDSLVYELCTPTDIDVNTSGFPPTSDVGGIDWKPPFSRTNMLNGQDSMTIDPQTGIVRGTPNILGIFLVGICVKEYRNGVLLSITKRDFQHLIGDCRELNAADFEFSKPACNTTLTYNFRDRVQLTSGSLAWQFDTFGSSNNSDPSFTFPDTGSYAVQLVAGAGSLCQDTITKIVAVQLDGVEISAQGDSLRCELDTMLLTAINELSTDTDSLRYQWSPRTGILGVSNTDTLHVFIPQSQNYQVIATNNLGCSDTAYTAAVVVSRAPVLTITASADSIFLGQQVNLFATNDASYNYVWTANPTLSTTTAYDPTARPLQSTSYYLQVENTEGCMTIDSIQILVKAPICGLPVVFIPNAFSPDGDGYNDELRVEGNNITTITLAVYNRWGEQVFETQDQGIGWDGRFKGTDLPPDVYGYYLQCTCDDGSTLKTKGNVTLLR